VSNKSRIDIVAALVTEALFILFLIFLLCNNLSIADKDAYWTQPIDITEAHDTTTLF